MTAIEVSAVMMPLIRMATVELGNLFDVRIEFNELVCDIYQARAGVGAKTCQFNAHAFVSHGVYGVGEIFITRNQNGGVVLIGKRKHIHGNFNIKVCFLGAVGVGLQLFFDNAVAISS